MTEFGKITEQIAKNPKSALQQVKVQVYFNYIVCRFEKQKFIFVSFPNSVIQKVKVQVSKLKYKSQTIETCTFTLCMTEFGKITEKIAKNPKSALQQVKVQVYFNYIVCRFEKQKFIFVSFPNSVIQKVKVQVSKLKYKSQTIETCTLTL